MGACIWTTTCLSAMIVNSTIICKYFSFSLILCPVSLKFKSVLFSLLSVHLSVFSPRNSLATYVTSHPKLLWLDVTKHTIGHGPNGHQAIDKVSNNMKHAADVEGCKINAGLKRLSRYCESPDYVAGISSPSSFLWFGCFKCGLVVPVNW